MTTTGRRIDIPRSLDASAFTHRGVRGDFRISTRVDSVLGLEPLVSIGLMARDSLANHLFKGPALPHPGIEACGEDGEEDGLAECSQQACE